MKMKKEEFERIALEQGYDSGKELFEAICFNAEDYENISDGAEINRDTLLRLYRELGTSDAIDCVEFGSYEWEQNIDLFDEV